MVSPGIQLSGRRRFLLVATIRVGISGFEQRHFFLRRSKLWVHAILELIVGHNLLFDLIDSRISFDVAVRLSVPQDLAPDTVRLLTSVVVEFNLRRRKSVIFLSLLIHLFLDLEDSGKLELLPWPDVHVYILEYN